MSKNQLLFLILLFSCGLFSGGCAKKTEVPENNLNIRHSIMTEYLQDTERVVQRINDSEATEIFNFIQENAMLAEPTELGAKIIHGKKSDFNILIIPLLEIDADVGGEKWKEVFDTKAAALFLPDLQGIAMKQFIAYSPVSKALIFLHESFHAAVFSELPYEIQSDDEYAAEEVEAHSFQNKIMSKIGGEKYQAALAQEVARITEFEKSKGIIPFGMECIALSEIFGPPASQEEKEFIQTSFWIHAAFTFLEGKFPEDADEYKANFLLMIYSSMEDAIL